MKKLLILVVLAAGGWFVYMNWDSMRGNAPTTKDYAMKEYKKSLDKARQVEDTIQQAKDRLDQARP